MAATAEVGEPFDRRDVDSRGLPGFRARPRDADLQPASSRNGYRRSPRAKHGEPDVCAELADVLLEDWPSRSMSEAGSESLASAAGVTRDAAIGSRAATQRYLKALIVRAGSL